MIYIYIYDWIYFQIFSFQIVAIRSLWRDNQLAICCFVNFVQRNFTLNVALNFSTQLWVFPLFSPLWKNHLIHSGILTIRKRHFIGIENSKYFSWRVINNVYSSIDHWNEGEVFRIDYRCESPFNDAIHPENVKYKSSVYYYP